MGLVDIDSVYEDYKKSKKEQEDRKLAGGGLRRFSLTMGAAQEVIFLTDKFCDLFEYQFAVMGDNGRPKWHNYITAIPKEELRGREDFLSARFGYPSKKIITLVANRIIEADGVELENPVWYLSWLVMLQKNTGSLTDIKKEIQKDYGTRLLYGAKCIVRRDAVDDKSPTTGSNWNFKKRLSSEEIETTIGEEEITRSGKIIANMEETWKPLSYDEVYQNGLWRRALPKDRKSSYKKSDVKKQAPPKPDWDDEESIPFDTKY